MTEPALTLEEVKAKLEKAPAPRVTEESIKAKITNVEYLRHGHLTICIITLANGWMAVGKSAPASAENYDPAVGQRYAYDNAFKEFWQLEGYLLRDRLASEGDAGATPGVASGLDADTQTATPPMAEQDPDSAIRGAYHSFTLLLHHLGRTNPDIPVDSARFGSRHLALAHTHAELARLYAEEHLRRQEA